MDSIFLHTLRLEKTARFPTWLMRQAGRSMAAFRALRIKHSFLEIAKTPELAAEVTLQPVEAYGVDAAILFSDILFVLEALGLGLDFAPGPVIKNPIRTPEDVERLARRDIKECCGYILDAVRASRERLAGRAPLIGFTGGPLTLAMYAIEGGRLGDMPHTRALYKENPAAFAALLDRIADAAGALLAAQAEAGADALMIFDSWAAALGANTFRETALPHLKKITAAAKAAGHPLIFFARDTETLLPYLAEVGADAYAVDWTVSLTDARKTLGDGAALMGNLKPEILHGKPDAVRATAMVLLGEAADLGAVIPSLGHGVPPDTPEENVRLFVDTVHEYKKERQ